MKTSFSRFLFTSLVAVLIGSICAEAQNSKSAKAIERSECHQAKQERNSLIGKAEVDQYNVLYVEFLGNSRLSGRDLFKRTKPILDEGDIFTRKNLESAIKSVSKIKSIYPVTIDNVVIRLNETKKDINILFCIDEKPKK